MGGNFNQAMWAGKGGSKPSRRPVTLARRNYSTCRKKKTKGTQYGFEKTINTLKVG